MRPFNVDFARAYYQAARGAVFAHGFEGEVAWQTNRRLDTVDESTFLREAAWVILNSGFRESVVRKHFNFISLCFCDWESAQTIVEAHEMCVATALQCFANRRKFAAIVDVCREVYETGFKTFAARLRDDAVTTIRALSGFGPVTSFHLAKNLGADVAKPDRHLVRIARRFGEEDVQVFCRALSRVTGDPVSVVDVTLWRYAALGEPGSTGTIRPAAQSQALVSAS